MKRYFSVRAVGQHLEAAANPELGDLAAWLAEYVESDIQGSLAAVHDVLAKLDLTEAGRIEGFIRSGNQFDVTVADGVVIADQFSTGKVALSLGEFRDALIQWRDGVLDDIIAHRGKFLI